MFLDTAGPTCLYWRPKRPSFITPHASYTSQQQTDMHMDRGAKINHLELGRIVEVCGANGSAADVPLGATADNSNLLSLHDIQQLSSYLPCFSQSFHL